MPGGKKNNPFEKWQASWGEIEQQYVVRVSSEGGGEEQFGFEVCNSGSLLFTLTGNEELVWRLR